MVRYVTLSILSILFVAGMTPAEEGDGGYAGSYFQIPIGARPTALGGAYLAVSDDGAGPLFNPAGLADLKRPLFAASYRLLKLDRSLGYVTAMFPVRGNAAIGVNWLYTGAHDITMRDKNGTDLGIDLSFDHHAVGVVFAKRFEGYLSAALKVNYLHATFAEMTAFSVSFDLGLMLYINQFVDRETRDLWPVQDFRVGVVVKHLAAKYRWNNHNYLIEFGDPSALSTEQDDKVPVEVGLGVSARFLERKLLVAADVLKNEKQGPFFHGGAEYLFVPEFAVRGGYSDGRFTAGAGFLFNVGKRLLAIDYAFSTDKVDEGSEHIFSMDFLF
ncbi:MAG: PorV/PorQ family protein [Candidatus Zixiibacteriota bacterium]